MMSCTRRDHRLAGVDAEFAEDRHQRLAERVEGLPGVRDVDDGNPPCDAWGLVAVV
jgi:hypothetical protein